MSPDTLNKRDRGQDPDRLTLKCLLAELSPKLHRYGARITGSVIDGEDVVHGAIFKTFEELPSAGAMAKSRGTAVSPPSQGGLQCNVTKEAKCSE